MNTLLVIDELGAAASVPGQLAKLTSGCRILYLGDTKHAPYRTLSRATVAMLAMQWLDLFREERPCAVLVASAVKGRVAAGAIRLGCARVGALVHTGAALVSSEVVRAHRFGEVAVLGSALVEAGALEGAVAAAGLAARVVEVVLPDVLVPGRPGEAWLSAVVEEVRATTGTYVLASGALRWCREWILRADPDAVVIEADGVMAIELACALEARASGQGPSKAMYYVTEWSEYWRGRIAELAGVDADAVFGRSPMPIGPTTGPFAIPVDEDGDPL